MEKERANLEMESVSIYSPIVPCVQENALSHARRCARPIRQAGLPIVFCLFIFWGPEIHPPDIAKQSSPLFSFKIII